MNIKKTFSDMKKVWKVTKKPSRKEYFQTLKIVFVGFAIIGIIALFMEIIKVLIFPILFGE
jgi:protein translocase SEC61 complex gamma subunit